MISGGIGFIIGYVLGMSITLVLVMRRELPKLPHVGEDMYDSFD